VFAQGRRTRRPFRKFKAAVEPLYPALSDEQKKTADQLLLGPMGMMGWE
jgi:hypothetical protein